MHLDSINSFSLHSQNKYHWKSKKRHWTHSSYLQKDKEYDSDNARKNRMFRLC